MGTHGYKRGMNMAAEYPKDEPLRIRPGMKCQPKTWVTNTQADLIIAAGLATEDELVRYSDVLPVPPAGGET
jgi:hypothetical protein